MQRLATLPSSTFIAAAWWCRCAYVDNYTPGPSPTPTPIPASTNVGYTDTSGYTSSGGNGGAIDCTLMPVTGSGTVTSISTNVQATQEVTQYTGAIYTNVNNTPTQLIANTPAH